MSNGKPKIFLVFKIVCLIGAALLITGIVLFIRGFNDFESNNFLIGIFLFPFGLMTCIPGFIIGFRPEITKASTKGTKYIQEENKEDLKEIATNSAEITSEAVATTARAVAEGLQQTKFCKHCGAKIDEDSKFCAFCGKEL